MIRQKLASKWTFAGLALVLAFGLAACGGGSGDSSDSSSGSNTCSNIGLTTKVLEIAKIRGGTECGVTNVSPVVMLWVTSADGRRGLCTGTMITNRTVLTAGHCLSDRVAVDVAYGTAGGGFLVQRASSWLAHPGYTYKDSQLINDVGVVYLSSPTGTATMPVFVSVTPKPGDLTSIYGYGVAGVNPNDSGVLRSGSSVISTVLDQKILAYYDGTRSNSCSGDSGGPMVLQVGAAKGVIGITSSGTSENCQAGDWSAYTKVQNASVHNFLRAAAPDASFI